MSAKSLKIRLACDLSPRQRDILLLMASGETIKAIALELNISRKTVEYHVGQLKERTGLYCPALLTQLALRIGLIEISV